MSTNSILLGTGLTVGLATGAQLLARLARVPGIVVLLPVGFAAGWLTDDVVPTNIVGAAFQPLVSVAVAVILFDAGLELDVAGLRGHARRVVQLLIGLGVPLTFVIGTLGALAFFDMSTPAALMLGAILVVSGPTVVGPLLTFVRPDRRLRTVLVWEGSLIDPIGATLGALVFTSIRLGGYQLGDFAGSLLVGAVGGIVGTAVLWLVFRVVPMSHPFGAQAALATVVAVAAGCDALREDAGLTAAILMGVALANIRRLEVPAQRPFFETFVHLTIGVLFVSISATVTPASVGRVLLPSIALVVVLVVVARPLVAFLATLGTDLSRRERAFVGWMAPRGIVAAATASTFSASLASHGVHGASDILPATFLVVVFTVSLYGLTAVPVSRLLRVTRPTRSRPLLVGGSRWSVDLARTLTAGGLSVVMWAGSERERDRIAAAGLELAPGRLLADATGRGEELAGITSVLFLTEQYDFNALAVASLAGSLDDGVYRLAGPSHTEGLVAPYAGGEVLFGPGVTAAALARRHGRGERFAVVPCAPPPADRTQGTADGAPSTVDGAASPLFLIREGGRLEPVTERSRPQPRSGDAWVLLGSEGGPGDGSG